MTVGERMHSILRPEDVERPALVVPPTRGRVFPHPNDVVVNVEPELPAKVGDRIRARLRAGDLEGAAELATLAMNSLGVDREGHPSD